MVLRNVKTIPEEVYRSRKTCLWSVILDNAQKFRNLESYRY